MTAIINFIVVMAIRTFVGGLGLFWAAYILSFDLGYWPACALALALRFAFAAVVKDWE
jgi:hypothetical protein